MSITIVIIDYDVGNLRNVQKAVEHLGYKAIITNKVNEILQGDAYILPGVGAFHEGMQHIEDQGIYHVLRKDVLQHKKPLLGICLGMQLLAKEGFEGGYREGLDLLPMSIHKLNSKEYGLCLPHIGWNEIYPRRGKLLFDGIPEMADFYFVHSYHAICNDTNIIAATTVYGHEFVASVEKDNIFATQFHPEKSQRYGLHVLKNFLTYCQSKDR